MQEKAAADAVEAEAKAEAEQPSAATAAKTLPFREAFRRARRGELRKRDFVRSRLLRWSSRFVARQEIEDCLLDAEGDEAEAACYDPLK